MRDAVAKVSRFKFGLEPTEAPLEDGEPKPFTWDDIRGRKHVGVAEQRCDWFLAFLRVGFVMNVLLVLLLLVCGAFVVGNSVRHAWRQGLSLDTVQAEIVRRTH